MLIAAVTGGVGLVAIGLAALRRRQAQRAAQKEAVLAAMDAPQEVPPTQAAEPGGLVDGLGGLLKGGQAEIVAVGVALGEAAAKAVEALGGGAVEQNLARLNAVQLGAPILVDALVNKGLAELGLKNETVRRAVSQAVAVAATSVALLPLFLLAKGLEVVVGGALGQASEPPDVPFREVLSPAELMSLGREPLNRKWVSLAAERRKALRLVHMQPGTHRVRVHVSSKELNGPPVFRLMVNQQVVTPGIAAVAEHFQGQWQEHQMRVMLTEGAETIGLLYQESAFSPPAEYRLLVVEWLEIDGARYLASEATYFRLEDAPNVGQDGMGPVIPGQPGLYWTGALVWTLRPEHRGGGRPAVIPSFGTKAFQEAEASSRILAPPAAEASQLKAPEPVQASRPRGTVNEL